MFTGIVTELGRVVGIDRTASGRRIVISAPGSTAGMRPGDSIAVNGVCLTATALDDGEVTIEAVEETLGRTNLGALVAGTVVDLERPMAGDGRFDGHIVQGHVDGVGTIRSIGPEGDARRIRIGIPAPLGPYVVEKGSVAVDGVSLTVTACSEAGAPDPWHEVVLIPHTLEVTVLGRRAVGDDVNLEMDVIAKYVERMLEAHR
jgi:riboflavin synthase